MTIRSIYFAVVAACVTSTTALPQSLDVGRVEEILREAVAADLPGIAIGVVYDGAVIYEGYRGLADLEHGVAVGPNTRFNIASNAKQFTALEILRRLDAGELALDQDVRDFVPELYPDLDQPLLIRDMLVHSSGLRDFYDLWAISGLTWWQEFVGNEDAIALLAGQTDLNFESGTDYLYSNSNYTILAEIIERQSDQSLAEATRPLFDALGMAQTTFTTGYMEIIPDRARGYGNFGQWVAFPAITDLYGDGWLRTTLRDQLRWERAVQSADSPDLGGLIAASQQPVEGAAHDRYGYGLEFGDYRGVQRVFHDGSTGAHNASLTRFPDIGLSIVVMSNNGQVGTRRIADQIADALLGDRLAATANPERPETLAARPENRAVLGLYDNSGTGSLIRIVEREGGLFREIEGREPVRLEHEEGNLFECETVPGLRMAFDETEAGVARLTIYYASQAPLSAIRVEEAPSSTDYLSSLTGRFENRETGSRIALSLGEDGGLVLEAFGSSNSVNVAIRDVIEVFGYRLSAVRGAGGAVERFELSGGRLRNVRYERVDGQPPNNRGNSERY